MERKADEDPGEQDGEREHKRAAARDRIARDQRFARFGPGSAIGETRADPTDEASTDLALRHARPALDAGSGHQGDPFRRRP